MAVEFQINSGGGGATIVGTPYYFTMFNAAGDNVTETNVLFGTSATAQTTKFKNLGGTDLLTFTLWNATPANTNLQLNWQNNFSWYVSKYGNTHISGIDDTVGNYAHIGVDITTKASFVSLNDFTNSRLVTLQNINGLQIINNGVTFTFPTADGSANQVLKTNGSGVLSWATASSGDMVLASVQTNSGAKTFLDQTLLFRNPANTFSYTIAAGAIAANRTLNLPVITATDTIAVLGLAQTFTAAQTISAALAINTNSNGYTFTLGATATTLQATNSGGNLLAQVAIVPKLQTGTAGSFGFFMSNTLGLIFSAINSTPLNIQRASISLTNLTNTAGSETGDLTFATQSAGAAATSKVTITAKGNVLLAVPGALATNATDGFTYIPTCAGTPTGVPTAATGMVAMVYDTTNNKFYIYNGGWLGGTVPGIFV